MLIKNTDGSYCKIKEIKVSGLKAYITLIIYSSVPQTSQDNMGNIHRVFSFYLRDLNSSNLYKLSENNYWIDRVNNYENNVTNIDINMHKEIILEVDITNNNKSEMQDSRWIRRCNLIMIDHTTSFEEAWISEELELISKEIELPTIKKFKTYTTKDNTLITRFNLCYETQEDFNYTNQNLTTIINIKSAYSGQIVESLEYPELVGDSPIFDITFMSEHTYTEPVIIEILINNLQGTTLKVYSYFFNPKLGIINLTIKDAEPIRVKTVTIKDDDTLQVKTISHN